MKILPYGRQQITEEDIQAVVEVLRSDYLTQGPTIRAFEEAFADYVGSRYAVAVANGTAALHLCVLALDLKPGDKVITTPLTFVASANCVRYAGGEVVFADIDPDTYLLDIQKTRALLEKAPKGTYKGIIPVDFAGYPVDLEAYRALADEYNLWIIEDACHAPGGGFEDTSGCIHRCGDGSLADLAIFSFHPVKHIAAGEGGMITTSNEALYRRLLNLRTHGIQQNRSMLREDHGPWYYEMQELGYNYRLTDVASALGLSQLKRADVGLSKRRVIAERYDKAFEGTSIRIPFRDARSYHAFHLYVIQHPRRDQLIQHLRSIGIFAQVHYIPAHLMPYYQDLGWRKGDLPVVEEYYKQCLSIPMYPSLDSADQDFVIEEIKKICLA
jgi:UDP-4-amino-4,6-dideoxy-N-acetyl-beta-L-altrosamine transaminase